MGTNWILPIHILQVIILLLAMALNYIIRDLGHPLIGFALFMLINFLTMIFVIWYITNDLRNLNQGGTKK